MRTYWLDNLSLAGSPVQWAILAVVLVMIFAPRLLPPLARLFGRLLQRELRSRLGLPLPPQRPMPDAQRPPDMEARPPESPQPTLRASDPAPSPKPRSAPSLKPIWGAVVLVGGTIAVLLWYLLHSR